MIERHQSMLACGTMDFILGRLIKIHIASLSAKLVLLTKNMVVVYASKPPYYILRSRREESDSRRRKKKGSCSSNPLCFDKISPTKSDGIAVDKKDEKLDKRFRKKKHRV